MEFFKNELYHVYNRGNNRQKIFFKPENYIFFHYCPAKIGFKMYVILCSQRLQVKNLLFQYRG